MAEMEQSYLPTAVDPDFQAFAFLPESIDPRQLPYPCSIRLAPEANPDWRRMGSGSDQPLQYSISILVLVGVSSNLPGALMEEASRYILPMFGLYKQNPTLGGTVRSFEMGAAEQGDVTLYGEKHYGVRFPIITSQYMTYPPAPVLPPDEP